MKKIFLTGTAKELPSLLSQGLVERGLAARIVMVADVKEADIILGNPGKIAEMVEDVTAGWVQSTFAGVNTLWSANGCLLREGVLLTRAEGMFGESMAEYVMGHVLHRERRLGDAVKFQGERNWKETDYFRECRPIRGMTMGILGYGAIGKKVAAAARCFGMKTIGFTRSTEGEGVTHDLGEVLSASDYVVNLLPETRQTVGLLTAGLFATHCTRRPTFINCGRGSVITEAEILTALDSDTLSAAILDVFPTEPLPATSPLWTHPSITITPHISALTLPADIVSLFLDNLECYLNDTPLRGIVNHTSGY